MIHDQDLAMLLWEEACNTTIYVQKRIPHKILGDKNLEKEFSRVNLEIGHLRIFDCLFYIHVHVDKRTKMEPLGYKGIFVGYNDTSKDYRVFIRVQMKTNASRDVKF